MRKAREALRGRLGRCGRSVRKAREARCGRRGRRGAEGAEGSVRKARKARCGRRGRLGAEGAEGAVRKARKALRGRRGRLCAEGAEGSARKAREALRGRLVRRVGQFGFAPDSITAIIVDGYPIQEVPVHDRPPPANQPPAGTRPQSPYSDPRRTAQPRHQHADGAIESIRACRWRHRPAGRIRLGSGAAVRRRGDRINPPVPPSSRPADPVRPSGTTAVEGGVRTGSIRPSPSSRPPDASARLAPLRWAAWDRRARGVEGRGRFAGAAAGCRTRRWRGARWGGRTRRR